MNDQVQTQTYVSFKTVFPNFSDDANLLPKNMDASFVFKIRIPSGLAQNVLCKLRNDFKTN